MRILIENPIFMRVMRSRMRGAKTFWGFIAFLFIICAIWLIMAIDLSDIHLRSHYYGHRLYAEIGRNTFIALAIVEAIWVLLYAPLSTAGVVTTEREKQTLEMLKVTPLSPQKFIMGHLLSTLAYIFIMLLSALPLMFLSVMLGGISPLEVGRITLMFLFASPVLASIGLVSSALNTKTSNANSSAVGMAVIILLIISVIIPSSSVLAGYYGLNFYGLEISLYVMIPPLAILITWAFFNIAANKLYSKDRPGLSYFQMAIVIFFIQIFIQGTLWEGLKSVVTFLMIVLSFTIGLCILIDLGYYRPISDKLKRFKSKIFFLRGLDDFMAGFFVILGIMFVSLLPGYLTMGKDWYFLILLAANISTFVWLFAVGLLMGTILQKSGKKMIVRRLIILILLIIGIAPPVVAIILEVLFEAKILFEDKWDTAFYLLQMNPLTGLSIVMVSLERVNLKNNLRELYTVLPSAIFPFLLLIIAYFIHFIGNKSHVSKSTLDQGTPEPNSG